MDTATPAKPQTRCRWTPEERAEWVALFEASGQTVSQFCRENDLPVPTLSAWRTQQRTPAEDDQDGGFIEVPAETIEAAASSTPPSQSVLAATLQLRVGNVELSVAAGTDPTWLADLIRALQA